MWSACTAQQYSRIAYEVYPHNKTSRLQKAESTTQQGCMTQTGAEFLFMLMWQCYMHAKLCMAAVACNAMTQQDFRSSCRCYTYSFAALMCLCGVLLYCITVDAEVFDTITRCLEKMMVVMKALKWNV